MTRKVAFLFCWSIALFIGFGILLVYGNTPGVQSRSLQIWPSDTNLIGFNGRPGLLVFVHPKCSCTRATIGELERIMTKIVGKADVRVIFYRPKEESMTWVESSTWDSVKRIPTVTTEIDTEGVEARKFGVETSGQVLLFDEHGRLEFRGGITPARGHMGDSAGRDAILAYFEGQNSMDQVSESSVFGCSLRKLASMASELDSKGPNTHE